jgi:hypothetical protein
VLHLHKSKSRVQTPPRMADDPYEQRKRTTFRRSRAHPNAIAAQGGLARTSLGAVARRVRSMSLIWRKDTTRSPT